MSARIAAWSVAAVTLVVVATTAFLAVLNLESIRSPDQANMIEMVLPIGFAILGAVVASRQPRNAVGWLFLAIAFFSAAPGATTQYARYALITQRDAPFTAWIPWFGYLAISLVYPAGLAAMALLLMPNGHLLSRRWIWVGVSGVALTVVLLALAILDPQMLDLPGLRDVPNPTGASGLEWMSQGPVGTWAFLGGLGVLALAATSVVLKLRAARGEERLQLRWVAYTAAFAVSVNVGFTLLSLVVLPMSSVAIVSMILVIAGFGIALPLGFAVAMLRYRLYDLDLILNRTLLYGGVSVVLLVVFGAVNLLAQRALIELFDQRSDLLAAAVGLSAGLAFAPVRRWLRPFVDRALPARARLTLLFTDIVASTQAIVDLGDERWREVLDRFRTTVRQELARHRGREVNTAGDAFFAVFDRPANGVRCALAMREAVAELGLRVRTGLHVGEVEMRGEQVSGLAVHAAARVMGQAAPDRVLVSAELAAELSGVALRDAGRHDLKGVPGEWRLYEVTGVS